MLAFLLRLDLDKRREEIDRLQREDEIGRLLINLGTTSSPIKTNAKSKAARKVINNTSDSDSSGQQARVVPLSRLRSSSRPVLLIGDSQYINSVLQKAQKWRSEFIKRGVIFIPYIRNNSNDSNNYNKGFSNSSSSSSSSSNSKSDGFVVGAVGDGSGMVKMNKNRFRLN